MKLPATERASTGVVGLDDILGGGLPKNRVYLVTGSPGVGKTTLALQFLLAGIEAGEKSLYLTLSETEAEIRQIADSHGWSLDKLDMFELSSAEQTLRLDDENTLYAPEDVDLKETVRVLLEKVESTGASRVVFDSLSEIQLLAGSAVRFRRQLLALKQHFAGKSCTVLLLDDKAGHANEQQVESLAHGVIKIEQAPLGYGADRRRLRVSKLRGSTFRSGYHDLTIRSGGLEVFPRLVAAEHRSELAAEPISSGVAELDAMLGGGIDRSTSTLVIGPAGTGKSAIATQLAIGSIRASGNATVFLFEERIGTWRKRAAQLGMPVEALMAEGRLHVQQLDPAEVAPDEFAHLVRGAVERDDAKLVVIDSITGYFSAMPEARHLSLQMHELLSYLSERGVATILTMAQSGLAGTVMTSPVDVSYLADTVMVLRYFETEGRIRKAASVLKKRSGTHEDAIRIFELSETGIRLGPSLTNYRGVFSGLPQRLDADGSG